jgi:hypothetical protein
MVTVKSFTKPDNPQRGPGNRGINIDGQWYGVADKVYDYYHNKTPVEVSDFKMDDAGKVTYLTVTSSGSGSYNRKPAQSRPNIEDSARLRRRCDCFIMAKDLVVAGILEIEKLREYAETLNKVVEGEIVEASFPGEPDNAPEQNQQNQEKDAKDLEGFY